MSETVRAPWDTVWKMTAIEFLNILSYRHDRDEMEAERDKVTKMTL